MSTRFVSFVLGKIYLDFACMSVKVPSDTNAILTFKRVPFKLDHSSKLFYNLDVTNVRQPIKYYLSR